MSTPTPPGAAGDETGPVHDQGEAAYDEPAVTDPTSDTTSDTTSIESARAATPAPRRDFRNRTVKLWAAGVAAAAVLLLGGLGGAAVYAVVDDGGRGDRFGRVGGPDGRPPGPSEFGGHGAGQQGRVPGGHGQPSGPRDGVPDIPPEGQTSPSSPPSETPAPSGSSDGSPGSTSGDNT